MCSTSDGFVIAEEDLKLRGPGDLEGTQQSGTVHLRLADLAADVHILEEARKCALRLMQEDPKLLKPENQALLHYLKEGRQGTEWGRIS